MNKKKLSIAVLAGGSSPEKDFSYQSGITIFQNLDRKKYNVKIYDPAYDLVEIAKNKDSIDLAFLAMHGQRGEDGTIQGFLELLNIPYTGSGIRASANAIDKITTKKICQIHGLPVPKCIVLAKDEESNLAEIIKEIHLPCIIKPARCGSTIGIDIAHTKNKLVSAIKKARKYDPYILIEKYIEGSELSICVFEDNGIKNFPIIEIIKKGEFLDYRDKKNAQNLKINCPASIPTKIETQAKEIAQRAYEVIGCNGIANVELIWNQKTNEIFILEINTIPKMTINSLLTRAAKSSGLPYTKLLNLIIEKSYEKYKK